MRTVARKRPARVTEHWYALGAFLLALGLALALQGYARHVIGKASTRTLDPSPGVPEFVDAGPIIDLSGPTMRSTHVPPRTVALTFDDGPDPRWTPRILDVLARYNVKATFFVIGSNVAAHPGLTERIAREGHEFGNHTFTHIDFLRASPVVARTELRLTEVALAAATGRHTLLLRPPYSSEPDAVRERTLEAWRREAGDDYLFVLTTHDSEDWQKDRSTDAMVASAMPEGNDGGIILMHDGGGNRRNTVEALEKLIPALRARGYTFEAVSDIARLPRNTVMPAVDDTERLRSRALPAALGVSYWVAEAFTVFALLAAALAVLRAIFLALFARRHDHAVQPPDPTFTPSVTILVPAYNEQSGIEAALMSLAQSDYPAFDVIVVDDGSTDTTPDIVKKVIEREGYAHVRLLRQANAGKSEALNTGFAQARGDIIVTVDADTVFQPEALSMLVQRFVDPHVGAVSGNTKVVNRGRLLGRWQHIEYVMGFNLDRRMYDRLGCMPTVPGAIGAFRAHALRVVGGFSDVTLAEDTDVTMALHRGGWTVAYEPRAIAWTEAPSRLRDLWKQRYRWSYGTLQSVWKHRRAAVEPGHGRQLGRVGLPYLLLFQVALPLLGPAVDLFALYGLIFLDRKVFAFYWIAFTLLQVATAAYALRLDKESLTTLWAVPAQQLVYRQLMYLVVIQSMATALSGVRMGWHQSRRTGAIQTPQRAGTVSKPV